MVIRNIVFTCKIERLIESFIALRCESTIFFFFKFFFDFFAVVAVVVVVFAFGRAGEGLADRRGL